jgi:hypothetical protein
MKLLKVLDFLGNEPQTYIFKMNRYKTRLGGLFSFLTVVIALTLSLYFAVIVFSRQQLTLVSSQTTSYTRSININSLPLLFLPAKTNGEVYSSTIVYPVFQLWNYYAENNGNANITTIPYKQCEQSDIKGYEDTFANFTNLGKYMCLNKTGVNLTIFGTNGDINGGYSKLLVYIARCTNGSALNPNTDKQSCVSSAQIDTVLSGTPLHLYMVYPDINIDFKDNENPFFSYLKTEDFVFPVQAMYKFTYYLKRTFISSDLGFVFEDLLKEDAYQYDRTESSVLIGSSFNIKEAYGVLITCLSQKADIHTRSYVKLQVLVANIGGVVNFIYLVAKLIVTFISSKTLLLKYINKRVPDIKPKEMNLNSVSQIKLVNFNQNGITPQTE